MFISKIKNKKRKEKQSRVCLGCTAVFLKTRSFLKKPVSSTDRQRNRNEDGEDGDNRNGRDGDDGTQDGDDGDNRGADDGDGYDVED